MENYVKNTLQVNEEILFEPKLHWAVYFDTYFNAAFLYIIFCQFINGYIARAHFFITQIYCGYICLTSNLSVLS